MKDDKVNLKDIWPQERDYIIRTDRLKYVRRLKNEERCVFCKTSEEDVETYTEGNLSLFKTEHSQIILNKYPYNTGHLIVAPRRHTDSLFDLSTEEYADLMKLVRFAGDVVCKVYPAQGLNIGVNHGKVAGAGIPEHLHWHVIPRWLGDTNFFPVICETKVFPETLEQSWVKIKAEIEKQKKDL